MKKKVIQIFVGSGDTFLGPNSNIKVKESGEFIQRLKRVLNSRDKDNTFVVNFHSPNETFKDISIFNDVEDTKYIKIVNCSFSFLSKDNEITVKSHSGNDLLFNGDQFSFFFRPHEYDIHLCGIDVNGVFVNIIKELMGEGYHVTVFSNAIKPFNNTNSFINSLVNNRNTKQRRKFRYCSYKSV